MTRIGVIASVICLGVTSSLAAQDPPAQDAKRAQISREELAGLLVFYERSATSPAYSERLRARAAYAGRVVGSRLEEGDFQVGDRVVLQVEGQQALPDTFTIASGQVLQFPELGNLELRGTLRSELDARAEEHLSRYIREVRLRSTSLVRIQFDGAVPRPGFYSVPAETPLPDAIMLAGGIGALGNIDGIRVERRGQRLLAGEAIQDALAEGRTLDELNLRGGDRIVVPDRQSVRSWAFTLRTVSLLLAIPFTVAAVLRLF